MSKANSLSWLAPAAGCALAIVAAPTSAQITPDATLPNNSVVLPSGNVLTIEGGTEAGTNLFHSFQDFDLPTGNEAFFNNALTIDNIITRVTGGNLSDIDGLIRANGTANLFLINPNGIQFGPNASLDIGGSFLGSTAESLLFKDGSFYSAKDANAPPLLTVNIPIGLQMGTNPGEIVVQGVGHNLTQSNRASPINRDMTAPGLQVRSGNTLALVGGKIRFHGGILSVEGGLIDLSSVRSGIVGLNPLSSGWTLNDENVSAFGKIELRSQSLVDVSGSLPGSISVRGGRVSISQGSFLLNQNQGLQSGGNININAFEVLEIVGADADQSLASTIASETIGDGDGGDVRVSAQRLSISGASRIETRSYSTANGGDLIFNIADSLKAFESGSARSNFTLIGAITFNAGDAGNVSVSVRRLSILDGNLLTSTTLGSGDGGEVTVNATELVEVVGIQPNISQSSTIGASTFNRGHAGNLSINTPQLTVRDGGRIDSSTFASGAAGSITINATESLELSGSRPIVRASEIISSADILSSFAQRVFRLPPVPTGASGNVTIETPRLLVGDTTAITVRNDGTNNAGNLEIVADIIEFDGSGVLNASTESGEGGNIALQVRNLKLRDSSQITAESGGTGNGGNVTIDADTIALLENSQINANAFQGVGGNIQITTSGLFVAPDSRITASSQFGVDGTVAINNPIVDPASGLIALDSDILNPNTQIQNRCDIATRSRFVFTGSGGLPEDPTQYLQPRTVWRDTRLGEIDSNLTPNPIDAESEEASAPTAPLVEATGWRTNDRGEVELIVASGNPSHSSWQPHRDCDEVSQDSTSLESFLR